MKKSRKSKKHQQQALEVFNPYAVEVKNDKDDKADEASFKPVQYEPSPMGGVRIKSQYDQPNVDNGQFLPRGALSILICGKAGSGKSRLLLTICPQLKISQMVIFSKIQDSPIYSDLRDFCHDPAKPDDRTSGSIKDIDFHIAHSLDEAPAVMEESIASKKPNTWGLCIFDDFNEYDTSRQNPYMKFINTAVGMLRNYQYHFVSVTQSYTNFSTLARTNAGCRFIFAINDINAVRRLKEDWLQMTDHTGEEFDGLYHIVRKVKHSYLMFSDDGRVFIYLANEDKKGLQLVEFSNIDKKLDEDNELHRLCKIAGNSDVSLNAIQRQQRMVAKKRLQAYIEYLCKSLDTDEASIHEYIYEKYKI